MLDESAAEYDPLSEQALIAFVFSPLVSSPLTTSAKFAVVCKSPLTMRFNDSLASSSFAISGKKTGSDAIVITGKAEQPSIIVIDNGKVRIESAADLWGLEISQAEQILADRFSSKFQFAIIGPAGENQVRFATISHDGRHAGRGGSGAVLGSKNIKAIAVRGDQPVAWADPSGLFLAAKELSKKSFGSATAKYRELGTASNLLAFNRLNCLPTRNFQSGNFEGVAEIAPETTSIAKSKTRKSCAACTIGCEHIYKIQKSTDPSSDSIQVRIEYENLFALGPLCGIQDPRIVMTATKRCDELGLDTISAGGTIAFAMECFERGLITDPAIEFGDGQKLLSLLDQIAVGEGAGEWLKDGSRSAAERIGQNSIDFAPQVKGLEIPGYEPRALQNMALGFAVNSRGADHNRSGAYEVDFGTQSDRRDLASSDIRLAIETEDKAAIMDSLIFCKFLRGVFDDFFAESADILKLVTGWKIDANEILQTAQRIVTAKKFFNIQAGWTEEEDTLPKRFLTQGLKNKDTESTQQSHSDSDSCDTLSKVDLDSAIKTYYRLRSWETDGNICKELLTKMELRK